MLNKRSFNPAKCKTALKLSGSRIKLLRNKKEAQVKQMNMELAKLLESGHDRTAMIRVEHVFMEEKKLSAYDLIEIYCELIVAHLSVIESQKKCPIDLKEAITSVVYAALRCADIPELMDARKHLTAKYGKDFISAAVELRPDCGVARMMIEKLSVKAPDSQGKIKILRSIAEGHNIKWDPSADNDPKPPKDLLNGASTFGKASQMYTDLPNVQVPPNSKSVHCQVERRVPISDPGSDNIKMEWRHSYSGNVQFKDAAAAAREAAECADRASMAARVAARLSIQYPPNSSNPTYNLESYSAASFAKDQVNDAKMQRNQNEQHILNGGVNQRSYNNGTRSSSFNDDTDPVVNRSQVTDGRNLSRPRRSGGMSFSKQSSKSEFDAFSEEQTSENIAQVRIRKQVSNSSSRSDARVVSNDSIGLVDPNNENHYTGIDEGIIWRDTIQTSSNDKAPLGFGSDAVHKYRELDISHPTTASRLDDMVPVTFDDSDGLSSESDVDVDRSGRMESSTKFGFSNFPSKLKKSNSDLLNEGKLGEVNDEFCASEELIRNKEYSSGLNLGMLRGGLRNKGYRQPLYTNNAVEDTSRTDQSPCPPGLSNASLTKTKANGKSRSMPSHAHLDHDSDFEVNLPKQTKAHSGNNVETSRTSTNARKVPKQEGSLKLAAREPPSDWSAIKSPSKEKPSHVHPKLPDIDSFTAHFQSLRRNR